MIRALQSDSNTNVIATPSAVTMDNQEAELKVAQEVPFRIRFRHREQPVVEPDLGLDAGGGIHPVDRSLHLARVIGVERAAKLLDVAGGIFDDFVAFDDAG